MSLDTFLSQLPELIRQDSTVWPSPPGQGPSHYPIARATKKWLLEREGVEDVELYAEGLNHEGIRPIPKERRGSFCGSWNWPDIALIHPLLAVAIEVDRARGMGGASIRTAMTKGSFNVLTGKFDRCDVLIFQEGTSSIVIDADSRLVFASYQKFFRTHVHLFERPPTGRIIPAG